VTVLGNISLWLTLMLAAWSVSLARFGSVRQSAALLESSRRAALVQPALLTIVVLSLVTALLRRDFNVAFVAAHSTRNLDTAFTLSAVSAAWNGALLLLLWACSLFSLPLLARIRGSHEFTRAATVLSGVILLGAATLLIANPLGRMGVTPMEGKGLDPALQDPSVLIAVPLLVIAGALIGRAALALASMGSAASVDAARGIERWLVGAWILLTLLLTLDTWHAYQTPGLGAPWRGPWSRVVAAVLWLGLSASLTGWWWLRRRSHRARSFSLPGALAVSGLLVLLIACLSMRSGWSEREVRLKSGGSVSLPSHFGGSYLVTNMGISRFEASDRYVTAATLDIERNERPLGLVTSERRQYFDVLGRPLGAPVIRAGIRRGVTEDLRVVLRENAGEQAVYAVRVIPLVSGLWLAAMLLIVSGLLRLFELGE